MTATGPRRVPRLGVALLLAALVVAALGLLAVRPPAVTLVAVPGSLTPVVAEVPHGSVAWEAGARPGQRVRSVEPAQGPWAWAVVETLSGPRPIRAAEVAEPLPLIIAACLLAVAAVGAAAAADLAWWLLVLALGLAVGSDLWLLPEPLGMSAMLLPALLGLAYATEPVRRPRFVLRALLVSGGAVAAVLAVALDVGQPAGWPDLAPVQAVGLAAVPLLVGLAGTATGRWVRLRTLRHLEAGLPARRAIGILLGARPVSAAGPRDGARIADELHEAVLPAFDAVAARLRDAGLDGEAAEVGIALDALRDLVGDRRLLVLESFGLLAALIDLAERTEEEHPGSSVELEVGDGKDPDGVPEPVAGLAYRTARAAVAAAVLADPTPRVRIDVAIDRDGLRLVVESTGPVRVERRPSRAGHLDLATLHAQAPSLGASLSVGPRSAGGTRVELRWTR